MVGGDRGGGGCAVSIVGGQIDMSGRELRRKAKEDMKEQASLG